MRRVAAAALTTATFLITATAASGGHGLELFDHEARTFAPTTPPRQVANQSPVTAWEFVATIATGNPHTDLDYFMQRGETFASVGTLGIGPNVGGQTIIQLTKDGEVGPFTPKFVSAHGSAFCPSNPVETLSLQHDVEATPKGHAILNTTWPFAVRRDTQLLVDATDAPGRCHDNGAAFGFLSAPPGGLELIDVTNVKFPKEIHLTSHIGEAHTVNVDPKRPHIAYAVTSDSIGVNPDGSRQNESSTDTDRFDLDGFEVVDMSSCMNFKPTATLEQKRAQCRPQVYRYRYPSSAAAIGHTLKSGNDGVIYGCHELEIYPNDRLTCGSGQAAMVFDMSGAFDRNGKPKGTPLPCRVRPSTSTGTKTDALVTDCVIGEKNGQPVDLSIPAWKAIGSPSLEGVRFVGAAYHQGRGGPHDTKQDNDFDHELELSGSGRLILATDERGGGVSPPDASCATATNDVLLRSNGGIHAYRVDSLLTSSPTGPDAAESAWQSYARTPAGDKAIYRAEPVTGVEPTVCTAHVFHQIPGQNRIFMGWYSQGTHVVDFVEHQDGTVTFQKAGHFIPLGANEWVSAIFKVRKNENGTYTYWGATGDFFISHGRNAIDIYKVTLPAPPRPFGSGGGAGGEGDCPSNDDVDADGLIDARESLLGTLLGNRDSDLDGIADGNDDANGNGEDDEDEDDEDDCPDRDSDGDGEDDEDEDDD
jgi:hypothetical protein